jgi:CPA1 family monovalent cation:H+ antiporter
VLITLAALFSYTNYRLLKLPTTIGVMLIALLFSLALVLLKTMGVSWLRFEERLLHGIDFDEVLLGGMLSFLLFAGALHIDLNDLARERWPIGILATAGVVLSTFLVGSAMWGVADALSLHLSFIQCLLFGALISPTDPIAVLGILKTAGAAKALETRISGESLFNDGVGVVVFTVLLGLAGEGHGADAHAGGGFSAPGVALLFGREALGGILFGLTIGYVAYRMLHSIDNYQVEVMITMALVVGGYGLARALHVSGPIAMVVAGLFVGNHGRLFAMSETTRDHLDKFWELVDEILNAVLFVIIGLEIVVLAMTRENLLLGLIAIPIVLLARFVSVGIPASVLKRFHEFSPRSIRIMTWGGLRGGISVALALSLPAGGERDAIVAVTYVVVVFSVLVQGLTVGKLVGGARSA